MTAKLRLRITSTAESILRSGHPWLYADSIREQNREGILGELAVVYDRNNRFLAIGLFDPDSPLRMRVLHVGKPVQIDSVWWQSHLQQAIGRRQAAGFDTQTTGYRWIHGESDGWPGLVLDRYDSTLVVKLYTAAWLPHWPLLIDLFQKAFSPERLVLRLSRNIQAQAEQKFQRRDGDIVFGPPIQGPVTFLENGLRFEAEVLRGQKTGFFLDQRENRQRIESLSSGREVLNVFSFSGGFSLYAARGGARSVMDVDISSHALDSSRRNFALNQSIPTVAACLQRRVQADAFEWLDQQSTRFDLVILDPPSLAKKESERARALAAYRRLALQGAARLRSTGLLVAASCSAHVSVSEFFEVVRQSTRTTWPRVIELATTRHPVDHPAAFREAEYLKTIYLRVED